MLIITNSEIREDTSKSQLYHSDYFSSNSACDKDLKTETKLIIKLKLAISSQGKSWRNVLPANGKAVYRVWIMKSMCI